MRASIVVAALTALTSPAVADQRIGVDELSAHVRTLASDAMGGRLAGSPGERAAADYIALQFEGARLLPAGANGYIDPFDFASGAALEPGNRLELRIGGEAETPELPAAWRPLGFSRPGTVEPAEMVFVGYGLVAPEVEGYDSFAGLDLTGKWAMAWLGVPSDAAVPDRAALAQSAGLRLKTAIAAGRGAVGVIFAPEPGLPYATELPAERFEAGPGQASIPALAIDRATAARLLGTLGPGFAETAAKLARGEAVTGKSLPDVSAGATVALSVTMVTGHNVLGRLGVGDPTAAPLVIGAHLDHLGHGETGTSLAVGNEAEKVHAGADDNASGVAALIEIAEALAARREAGRLRAVRDIVFAAWSGEELGLLGSRHFVDANVGGRRAAAYLNMDMIGRLSGNATAAGVGSSAFWPKLLAIAAANAPIEQTDSPYLPTDAMTFYLAGVPVLSFTTGVHGQYHTPGDLPETLDYHGMRMIAELVERIAATLVDGPTPPDYVALGAPPAETRRRRANVTLGTIPDYAANAPDGVAISGTVAGGPAAQAGLLSGDTIIGLAGASFSDIYGFMLVLNQLTPGEPVDIEVLRDGDRLKRRIVPVARAEP